MPPSSSFRPPLLIPGPPPPHSGLDPESLSIRRPEVLLASENRQKRWQRSTVSPARQQKGPKVRAARHGTGCPHPPHSGRPSSFRGHLHLIPGLTRNLCGHHRTKSPACQRKSAKTLAARHGASRLPAKRAESAGNGARGDLGASEKDRKCWRRGRKS